MLDDLRQHGLRAAAARLEGQGWTSARFAEADRRRWMAITRIRGIGPVTMLRIVNICRTEGHELGWFSEFDRESRGWPSLRGHDRVPPLSPADGAGQEGRQSGG